MCACRYWRESWGNHVFEAKMSTFVLTGCPKVDMNLNYVCTHPAAGLSSRSRENPRSFQRSDPRRRPLLAVFLWPGTRVVTFWFPCVLCHRTYPVTSCFRVSVSVSVADNDIQFPSGVTCRCVNENTSNSFLNSSSSHLPTSTCHFRSARSEASTALALVRLCDIGAVCVVVWLKLGHLGVSVDWRCMVKDWAGGDSMSPSSKPFEVRVISPLSCSGGISSVPGR